MAGRTRGSSLVAVVCLGAAALFLLRDAAAFAMGQQAGFKGKVERGEVRAARGELAARRGGASAAAASSYWEAEWICADCGYIYNERAFGSTKFEDLKMGFKCPACAAPRRRFARKLGDKVGTTLDGGDTPILLFSAGMLILVFALAYFSLQ